MPDSLRVLAATVNRVTRTGKVLGPEQRVTPLVALKAHTLWSAYQHFEEKSKGSIEVGKLADFAVLDHNPLKGDPLMLDKIKVMETIKEGKTVYRREDHAAKSTALQPCADSDACVRYASLALNNAGVIDICLYR
jgi:predicted amidohydrolase YtcJ